jgi:uncharacterized protein (DUF427 family)
VGELPDSAPFTFTPPVPQVEPTPRWIRVRAGDTLLADSRRALLLVRYGRNKLPTYALPAGDVRTDLLRPSTASTASPAEPEGPGEAFDHDVVVPDGVVERAARRFADPRLPELDDHWTFTWDAGVSWFEEATEVHVHALDPSKRVDVLPSERHVQVELNGEIVADSRRPHALFETSLPTRWYLPMEDVRQELLVPSTTQTRCPYKGTAQYWSVQVGDAVHQDIAWSYPEPIPECPRIRGLVAFFNERVELIIDGERQARPRTPWSPPDS